MESVIRVKRLCPDPELSRCQSVQLKMEGASSLRQEANIKSQIQKGITSLKYGVNRIVFLSILRDKCEIDGERC